MNMLLPLLLFDEDEAGDGAEADGDGRRKRATDDDASNDDTEDEFNWPSSGFGFPWVNRGPQGLGRKRRSADAVNEEKSDLDSSLKTLLLLQTMAEGNNGLDINSMMPFLLMDDSSDSDNLMMMVLMSSMTGGMDSADGFANNFNMLLPLLLGDDSSDGDDDMLFILLAMQSQAPGSSVGSSAMLPMLMMSSDSNNQELIMLMAMMNNQNCDVTYVQPAVPEPETETIYRTWKINDDGTRTLVSEDETN